MGRRDGARVILAVLLLLLSGCSQAVMKSYPGHNLPVDQIALVQSGPNTEIVSIDGSAVRGLALSVVPGPHTIVMRIEDNDQRAISVQYAFYSLSDASVNFIAQPGHRYVAFVSIVTSPLPASGKNDNGFRWVGYLHDATNDEVVAETDYLPVGVWPKFQDVGP